MEITFEKLLRSTINPKKLKIFFASGVSTQGVIDCLTDNLENQNFFQIWDSLLSAPKAELDKIFKIVIGILNYINTVELKSAQSQNLILRLTLLVPYFTPSQNLKLLDFCEDSIRSGDIKCLGWKDLLPAILTAMKYETRKIDINGVYVNGREAYQKIVERFIGVRWPVNISASIAAMFREIELTKVNLNSVLVKLCNTLNQFPALEIPPLAHHLFSLANGSSIVIPILALNKYFYTLKYKNQFDDLLENSEMTDYDSIEELSDKELLEAEHMVLYHLQSIAENTHIENLLLTVLKPLAHSPKYILTPFLMCCLLAVAKTSNHTNTMRFNQSTILPFLRQVIGQNDRYIEICKSSTWAKNLNQPTAPKLVKLFDILVENCGVYHDITTSGLVGLAFTLLKAKKSPALNELGCMILTKFMKKRSVFTEGVVKILTEQLFFDPGNSQLVDAFSELCLMFSASIASNVKLIEPLISHFLASNDETSSMNIMKLTYPLIKVSVNLRDIFLEKLRQTMYQRDINVRKMGVFGFCMVLRQLSNSNSRRAPTGICCMGIDSTQTAASISGYSLSSQSINLSHQNNPQRNFDVLVLEIIGVLGKCFTQCADIKRMLYSSLTKAVMINPKVLPHVMDFIEYHVRDYFDNENHILNFNINFDNVVKERNYQILIMDDLGQLLMFIVKCVDLCQSMHLTFDLQVYLRILERLLKELNTITLEDLGVFEVPDARGNIVGAQYLNCLEAVMAYGVLQSSSSNDYIKRVLILFDKYQSTYNSLRKLNDKKHVSKKGKRKNETADQSCNQQSKVKLVFKVDRIWDMKTIERLLRAVFDPDNFDCNSPELSKMRTDKSFIAFMLQSTIDCVDRVRYAPAYEHTKYSKSTYQMFSQASKTIYIKCVNKLDVLFDDFSDEIANMVAAAFKNVLETATSVFNHKLPDFFRILTSKDVSMDNNLFTIITNIQAFIDLATDPNQEEFNACDSPTEKILINCFSCLEILYDLLDSEKTYAKTSLTWLREFCENKELEHKSLSFIHRILFKQTLRLNLGEDFFMDVALMVSDHYETVDGNDKNLPDMTAEKLKSITIYTIEPTLDFLFVYLKKMIDDTEFFILRLNSLNARSKIPGNIPHDFEANSKIAERACSIRLIRITEIVHVLLNIGFPINSLMDHFIRTVTVYFFCMASMIRHVVARQQGITLAINMSSIKVDDLCKGTKKVAQRVYNLINYIDTNIELSATEPSEAPRKRSRKADNLADKQKILRDTKNLPKLIGSIETFNKWVMIMDRKTTSDLARFLHEGEVRDFRIQSKNLREAINQEVTESQAMVLDEDNLEDDIPDLDDEDIKKSSDSEESRHEPNLSGPDESEDESTPESIHEVAQGKQLMQQFLQNVATISKKGPKISVVNPKNKPAVKKRRT